MYLIILLALALSTTVEADCVACIHNHCQQKIVILERMDQTGQLAIDRTTNLFYFHVKNGKEHYTCAYDMDYVELLSIPGVDFSFARAVDEETRDLYISLGASVIKVNPKQNFTDGVIVFNKTIWHMQFKKKLYYKEFLIPGLKVFEDGKHEIIPALKDYDNIGEFVVDKNNDIYFQNDNSLYRLKHGEYKAELFSDEIYTMNTDSQGEAHFIQPFTRAIYKIDYTTDELVEIGAFSYGTPFNFVFNRANHIIYFDAKLNGIYLLVPMSGSCKLNTVIGRKAAVRTFSLDNE